MGMLCSTFIFLVFAYEGVGGQSSAASNRFEIWGVVETGQKILIFSGKYPKNFAFLR